MTLLFSLWMSAESVKADEKLFSQGVLKYKDVNSVILNYHLQRLFNFKKKIISHFRIPVTTSDVIRISLRKIPNPPSRVFERWLHYFQILRVIELRNKKWLQWNEMSEKSLEREATEFIVLTPHHYANFKSEKSDGYRKLWEIGLLRNNSLGKLAGLYENYIVLGEFYAESTRVDDGPFLMFLW